MDVEETATPTAARRLNGDAVREQCGKDEARCTRLKVYPGVLATQQLMGLVLCLCANGSADDRCSEDVTVTAMDSDDRWYGEQQQSGFAIGSPRSRGSSPGAGPQRAPQVEIDVERGWPFRFKAISDRTTCCLRASWQVFLFLLLFVQEILDGVTARDVARQVRGWKVSFFFLECYCADHPEEAK